MLVIGLLGCLRKTEIANIKMNNVKIQGKLLEIKIPDTKNGGTKSFVTNEQFYPIIEKYMNLRPQYLDPKVDRFFMQFRDQKCTRQVKFFHASTVRLFLLLLLVI